MSDVIKTQASCADSFDAEALNCATARQRILGDIKPIRSTEMVPIRQARGRYLAQTITSPINVPNHTNSAMDGYALRGEDLPDEGIKQYTIVGELMAGGRWDGSIGENQCLRIMTGAPMPAGADTVIMREQVEVDADQLRIDARHRKGQNVRLAGEDIAAGATILSPGRKLTPSDMGILASLGLGEVEVYRRPRVAFFSTGDELRSVGEPLGPGEVYDSNRYTLFGMLDKLGMDILDMGVVPDNPEIMRKAFTDAANEADVVITSGGVSMGDADYIKPILAELGQVGFWKIAIKPGRPLAFGHLSKALFFGLPGNPVAVMVTFYQFVEPALRFLAGSDIEAPLTLKATLGENLRKKPGRFEFPRAIMSISGQGDISVVKAGAQGSGILTSMSKANCYLLLPEDMSDPQAGDVVMIQPFEGLV